MRELEIGEQRATHFVNTLDMSRYTEGENEGKLLIDASIQQFSTRYATTGAVTVDLGRANDLPATALYPPGAEERIVWYTKPNDPHVTSQLKF